MSTEVNKEEELQGAKRLVDLKVREVSLVDEGAIQREFLVVKRKDDAHLEEDDEVIEETVEDIRTVHKNYVAEEVENLEIHFSGLSSDMHSALAFTSGVIEKCRENIQPCTEEDDYLEAVQKLLTKALHGHKEEEEKAVWSTAYINDLPDSAFLYIAPGGEKDSDGKTVPRSLRKFPVRDKDGKLDLPHLRNAIARIPQANGLSAEQKERLQGRARRMLADAQKSGPMRKDVHGELTELVNKLAVVLKNFDGSLVEDAEEAAATEENTLEENNVTKKDEASVKPETKEEEVAKSEAPASEASTGEEKEEAKSEDEAAEQVSKSDEEAPSEEKSSEEASEEPAADEKSEDKEEEKKEEEAEVSKQDSSEKPAWLDSFAATLQKSIEESLGSKIAAEVEKATKSVTEKVEDLEKSTKPLAEKVEQIEKARLPSTSVDAEGGNDDAVKQVKKGLWDGVL